MRQIICLKIQVPLAPARACNDICKTQEQLIRAIFQPKMLVFDNLGMRLNNQLSFSRITWHSSNKIDIINTVLCKVIKIWWYLDSFSLHILMPLQTHFKRMFVYIQISFISFHEINVAYIWTLLNLKCIPKIKAIKLHL